MKMEKRVKKSVAIILTLSVMSISLGAGIITQLNLAYNPNHAVSTEHPLIPMATTLEFDQNYNFTMDENETHYYKFWANTQTYILIELLGPPDELYVSMYYNPTVMVGGGSLIQKHVMIRKTTRIIRDGWVYFSIGHYLDKNTTQSYNLSLAFTPYTGQLNQYLYI